MPLRMVEYLCGKCGLRFESLEEVPVLPIVPCIATKDGCMMDHKGPCCKGTAELVISAPMVKKFWVEVQRGASDTPGPNDMTTCPKEFA